MKLFFYIEQAVRSRRIDPDEYICRAESLGKRINVPPLTDALLRQAKEAGCSWSSPTQIWSATSSLKAFLTFNDQPFRKTHHLEEIGEACLKIDSSLKDLVTEAVPLSEYAWAFRYPGDPETPQLEESQSALQIAKNVYKATLNRVPEESHPEV